MRHAGGHNHQFAGPGFDRLTGNDKLSFAIQYLAHGIIRGCMLAKPLAGFEGKERQWPDFLVNYRLADHGTGGIVHKIIQPDGARRGSVKTFFEGFGRLRRYTY